MQVNVNLNFWRVLSCDLRCRILSGMKAKLLLAGLLLLPFWVGAQELPGLDPATGEPLIDAGQSALQSLEALDRTLKLKEEELTAKLAELSAAEEESLREDLRNQVRELRGEIEEKRRPRRSVRFARCLPARWLNCVTNKPG